MEKVEGTVVSHQRRVLAVGRGRHTLSKMTGKASTEECNRKGYRAVTECILDMPKVLGSFPGVTINWERL